MTAPAWLAADLDPAPTAGQRPHSDYCNPCTCWDSVITAENGVGA